MAQIALTSPIKIQAVHNRPQLQTIQHGGHSRQANTETAHTSQSRTSNYNSQQNKAIANSAGGPGAQGQTMPRKMGVTAQTEPNDYNRNSSMNKSTNQGKMMDQAQLMGMSNGFGSVNSGQGGAHHVRYQSQLQQQNKMDMQARMNMTI